MRFFKAFNLLHRRTKSEPVVSFTPPPIVKDQRKSSSLFQLVTSRPAEISLDFHKTPPASRPAHSVQLIAAENMDYFTLRKDLERTRTKLAAQIQEAASLRQMVKQQQGVIEDLQKTLLLSQQRRTSLDSTLTSHLPSPFPSRRRLSAPDKSQHELCADEYSNALNLTLKTRKELRNQKKVSKFWKRKALNADSSSNIIVTPSASAISSIYEPLPQQRQAALDALIERRGLTTLLQNRSTRDDAQIAVSESFASQRSRLPPLASESIKVELSAFLKHDDSNRLSPDRERRKSLLSMHSDETTTEELSMSQKSRKSFEIDSFGDLKLIFESTFGRLTSQNRLSGPTIDDNQLMAEVAATKASKSIPLESAMPRLHHGHSTSSRKSTKGKPWEKYLSRTVSAPKYYKGGFATVKRPGGKGQEGKENIGIPVTSSLRPSTKGLGYP